MYCVMCIDYFGKRSPRKSGNRVSARRVGFWYYCMWGVRAKLILYYTGFACFREKLTEKMKRRGQVSTAGGREGFDNIWMRYSVLSTIQ